ncbi:glycoside hydrolase family 2 TIM barrel-domain containing protein [Amycolatopsis australiensis]|uniref:Beta-galactosidase n=1 Tax=Amycolatopsis australiensis TaxID=546364 RepID=A0A1K1S220_9PSEU|nr:glycoside hydrolase family 2 TIM barrel-domain containing protein [Amycolatopsis australiensis]SFW78210.1 beta-galactosidase [Amycolatopsis australiensis]
MPHTPSRRQVLGGLGAAVATSALAPVARAAGTLARPDLAVTGRATDLAAGWRFALVNPDGVTDPDGRFARAADPAFDDSAWQVVDVPHDWSIELPPVADGRTAGASGFFRGGLGWYRKSVTLPPSLAGKRVSVEFDGVYSDAHVHLNGELLGNHPCAYTGFAFDLTGRLHTDGRTPNVLAVRAVNPMPSSRWYAGSGIYRRVRLVVTEPVHVARHGTFVTTPGIAAGRGTVRVATDVVNDSAAPVTAEVRTTVTGPEGRVVAAGSATVAVPAGGTATAVTTPDVAGPRLWSVGSPVLYGLRTDVAVAGRVLDTTSTAFGFRYPEFHPDHGFSLNGEPMKLRGVNLHSTQGPLGAVVDAAALERQMRLMLAMGANALRTAHNPPDPQLVTICEQLGILMMVEAFDCWRTGKVEYDYHRDFDAWSARDIGEMVHAAKNSPAVVLWSIGNEVPDASMAGGPGIAAGLIAAVRAIDPTRPVVMGSDRYRSVPAPGSPQDLILRQLDGLGVNYNTAQSIDGLHAKYPDKFFFESESSSATSTRGVYQDPDLLNTGENHTPGKRATSSYDNNLASWTFSGEYSLKKDRDRKFCQGQFLWAGQDYLGEPTPYDVFPVKTSFFGAIDSAGLPKDAFHLFRSQWTTAPMVHLTPMDWTRHRPGEPVAVWVYSTVDTVELVLNGRSLGVQRFDRKTTVDGRPYLETTEATGDDKNDPSGSYTSPNGSRGKLHLTWTVPFEPGTLTAIATSGGREVARDRLVTAGPPRALTLTAEPRGQGAMTFVTASVVDEHGVVVPGAEPVLRFTVRGPGRVAGVDNGRQENAQSYQQPAIPAFGGQAVAVIAATGGRGPITVTVSSPGLAPGNVTVPGTSLGQRNGPGARAVERPASPGLAAADASYSGAPDTVPAAMLDGDPATGWSNFYVKQATATLNAVSRPREQDHGVHRRQGASASSPCGLAALRPTAVAMRLIAATRLSFNGPRIAFGTKFGPPWPALVARRSFASAICVSSSCRLRRTSAWAWAGIAGSRLATSGQLICPPALVPPVCTGAEAAGAGAAWPPRAHVASRPRPCGFTPWRPIAMAIRSIVDVRLSASGPRIAFGTKFEPPWPALVARRSFASAICVSSSCRLRRTSAWAGIAGSRLATSGHVIRLPDAALAWPGSPTVVAITSAPPAIARPRAAVASFVRRERRCRPP